MTIPIRRGPEPRPNVDDDSDAPAPSRSVGGRHVMRWIRSEDASVHDIATGSHLRTRRTRDERPLVFCVFDDMVIGMGAVITDVAHNALLAAWERYAIQVIADRVVGTLPTITVQFQCSSDGRHWTNKVTTPEIDTQPLVVGAVTDVAGFDEAWRPAFDRGRLRISLGGTNPEAHLKIWVAPRSML